MTRRGPIGMIAVASVLMLAACGAPESGLLPPPSSTSSTSTTPTTTPVDYSQIALGRFPGETTTTEPISEGDATVRGVVVGPDGAVAGGVVRVERLVGDVVQRNDVGTNASGGFILSGVPGGRYRVRAFQAPRLTMMDVEVFFMADGDDKELRLQTEVYEGLSVTSSTTPANPVAGQGVNLAVRVAQRVVDGDGIGRESPQAGVPVRLRTSGFTQVESAPPTTTTTAPEDDDTDPDDPDDPDDDEPEEPDEDPVEVARVTDGGGVIVFQLACDGAGSTTASVVIGEGETEQTVPIDVPPCSPAPTTTTAAPPGDGDEATTTTEP